MADFLKTIKGLFFSAPAAPKSTGLLGSNLAEVQTTHDLFVFFHFAPIGRESLSEQRVATAFKPTGDAFHELVTLFVTTDATGTIQVLRLVVNRSFIDDPGKCIYAADLVKSFLGSVNPETPEDKIALLAREISGRSVKRSSMPMLSAGPVPTADGPPTAAYLTYIGQGPAQTLFNSASTVQLLVQNDLRAQPPVLELILSSRTPKKV
jgi:hypothetical protein